MRLASTNEAVATRDVFDELLSAFDGLASHEKPSVLESCGIACGDGSKEALLRARFEFSMVLQRMRRRTQHLELCEKLFVPRIQLLTGARTLGDNLNKILEWKKGAEEFQELQHASALME